MNVYGLASNFYLSDNPIYLSISDISVSALYVEVYITRLTETGATHSVSKPQKLYNLSNVLRLDIAPTVKSLLPEPAHDKDYDSPGEIPFYNNHIQAKVTVSQVIGAPSQSTGRPNYTTSVTLTFTKYFLRGGKRTEGENRNLISGQNLFLSDKIPTWPGYPIDYYYTSSTSGVLKSNTIPEHLREDRTLKGCEPLYVKFMNSLGGYSYWLFENWEEEESSSNIGSVNRGSDILDLGSKYDSELTLISKIPQRFLPLLKDLIISREIYVYDEDSQQWSRITSENNKITDNPYSVNTKVKLKFKPFTRYNPSLIW